MQDLSRPQRFIPGAGTPPKVPSRQPEEERSFQELIAQLSSDSELSDISSESEEEVPSFPNQDIMVAPTAQSSAARSGSTRGEASRRYSAVNEKPRHDPFFELNRSAIVSPTPPVLREAETAKERFSTGSPKPNGYDVYYPSRHSSKGKEREDFGRIGNTAVFSAPQPNVPSDRIPRHRQAGDRYVPWRPWPGQPSRARALESIARDELPTRQSSTRAGEASTSSGARSTENQAGNSASRMQSIQNVPGEDTEIYRTLQEIDEGMRNMTIEPVDDAVLRRLLGSRDPLRAQLGDWQDEARRAPQPVAPSLRDLADMQLYYPAYYDNARTSGNFSCSRNPEASLTRVSPRYSTPYENARRNGNFSWNDTPEASSTRVSPQYLTPHEHARRNGIFGWSDTPEASSYRVSGDKRQISPLNVNARTAGEFGRGPNPRDGIVSSTTQTATGDRIISTAKHHPRTKGSARNIFGIFDDESEEDEQEQVTKDAKKSDSAESSLRDSNTSSSPGPTVEDGNESSPKQRSSEYPLNNTDSQIKHPRQQETRSESASAGIPDDSNDMISQEVIDYLQEMVADCSVYILGRLMEGAKLFRCGPRRQYKQD